MAMDDIEPRAMSVSFFEALQVQKSIAATPLSPLEVYKRNGIDIPCLLILVVVRSLEA